MTGVQTCALPICGDLDGDVERGGAVEKGAVECEHANAEEGERRVVDEQAAEEGELARRRVWEQGKEALGGPKVEDGCESESY